MNNGYLLFKKYDIELIYRFLWEFISEQDFV